MCLRIAFTSVVLFLLAVSVQSIVAGDSVPESSSTIDVLFSPKGGCEERIIRELGRAQRTIRIQSYSFTNLAIANAILDARRRGVDCELILDKSNLTSAYSAAPLLKSEGIRVLIDAEHGAADNKVVIIDDSTIMTGSYNFTRASEEENAHNLLILKGFPHVAAKYVENYLHHAEHSAPYVPQRVSETASPASPRPAAAEPATPHTPPVHAAPPARSVSEETGDGMVHVTRSGTRYHREGCHHLRGGSTEVPLAEAKNRYTPCSRCRPPE